MRIVCKLTVLDTMQQMIAFTYPPQYNKKNLCKRGTYMRYIVDHDLHIHSNLSTCSRCPEQTPERIAQYAVDMGLKTICITDHFWDEKVPGASAWYAPQNFPISAFASLFRSPRAYNFSLAVKRSWTKI